MVEKHSDSEQDRGEGHNSQNDAFFNPFAVAKQNQNSAYAEMNDDFSADSNKDEQDDDEEADFAKVSDMVGSGLRSEVDITPEEGTKAQQMVTTAAFRMSANDDLKKTANWSSAAAQETHDSSNKRLGWSEKSSTKQQQKAFLVASSYGLQQNPTQQFAHVKLEKSEDRNCLLASPGMRRSTNNERRQTNNQQQEPYRTPQPQKVENLKLSSKVLTSNASWKQNSRSSSKILSQADVTFISSQYATPPTVEVTNKVTKQKSSTSSFLARMQFANGHDQQPEMEESPAEVNPFDVAAEMEKTVEPACRSTDPLQQTFALLSVSDSSHRRAPQETAYTSEVNPFSIGPPQGVSDEPGSEKDQDVVRQNSVASFGNEGVGVHHQNSEDFRIRPQNTNKQTHNIIRHQLNVLKIQKQQNSAVAVVRQQRFSLDDGKNGKQPTGPVKVLPSRFSDASSKKSISSVQANQNNSSATIYRLKKNQINEFKNPDQYQISSREQVKRVPEAQLRQQSRDRLVTGTTNADSSERQSTARRESAHRNNRALRQKQHEPKYTSGQNVLAKKSQAAINVAASPELKINSSMTSIERGNVLQAQKSERENRLRQYGANFVRTDATNQQQQQLPDTAHLLNEVSTTKLNTQQSPTNLPSKRYQQQQSAQILHGSRLQQNYPDMSPQKYLQDFDYRRLNSQQHQQQWHSTNQVASGSGSPSRQINSLNQIQRLSGANHSLAEDAFIEAAKMGLINQENSRDGETMVQSPQSNHLSSFMKIRLSEDFNGKNFQSYDQQEQNYQAQYQQTQPSSPLYNKKAQTAAKKDIQEMISGAAYLGKSAGAVQRRNNTRQSQITIGSGMAQTKSAEATSDAGLRVPPPISGVQETGYAQGNYSNQQQTAYQKENAAQAIFRKISSQGVMQHSFSDAFDQYPSKGQKSSNAPEHCNHPVIEQHMQQVKAAKAAVQRNALGRHSIGVVASPPVMHNTSLYTEKQRSWGHGGGPSSRPIASKNMPQCFRANSLKRQQQQREQQQCDTSRQTNRNNSIGNENTIAQMSASKSRSFSNDAHFVLQQQQARQIAAQPILSNMVNIHGVIHTADGQRKMDSHRQMDLGNSNYVASGARQPMANLNNSSHNLQVAFEPPNMIFDSGRMNSCGPNELSNIHEMFPKFAVAPQSPPQQHQPFGQHYRQEREAWQPDDPFKQSM